MRWLPLLVLLAVFGCKSRVQSERDSDVYAGVGLSALPDLGGSITLGQYLWKRHPKSDFAFELRGTYQRGDDSATQSGKFAQVQAGVKQVTAPGHPRGWIFRYGATWFRATGDPNIVDIPGDYLGVYGSVGYEWVLSGGRWTIGPEFTVNVVNGEAQLPTEVLPQFTFNAFFNF